MEESAFFSQEEQKQQQPNQFVQAFSQSQLLANDFMFQQSLAFHQGSVRCVATLPSGYMMSGSLDKSTKLFMLNNSTGKYEFDKELNYHNAFVYAVAPSLLGDGFFTGGKDNKIFKVDLLGNPVMMYEGHESVVNSLHQSIPEELVSGSWDGTAKIWDVETGKVKQTLADHSHAVAVLSLPNGIIITGSQDKKIRIWYKGSLEREFVGHDDIIRDFTEIPGLGFASCSNDETVKLWSIDGGNLGELRGHTGFVFSLTTLDSGEIVSGSDDRTVRVWRGNECVQIINHPRTVWSVTQNHLGDLITGSEDYKIRTFTRDPTRRETGQALKDFEDEVQAQALGDQMDMDKLPSVDQLRSLRGKKDGEIRVFKNGTIAEAYCWKDGKWDKIGDVINPAGGQQSSKFYEGDRLFESGEYDHIFDVDLGDGLMRKLPFDNGTNAQVAADKFIIREGLNKAYVEQISTFIKNNSIPYATSENADKKQGLPGQQKSVSQVGVIGAQKQGVLPMKKFLFFDTINLDNPRKKIHEFNQELGMLNQNDLETLDSLLNLIKDKAFYHSNKCSKQGFDLVKKLLKFPADKALPSLDIYRMFLLHPQSSENYKVFELGLEYLANIISLIKDEGSSQNTQIAGLRCLANLFFNNASLYIMQSKRNFVLDNIVGFLYNDNKLVRQAAITIALNYSILFIDKNDAEGRIQLVSALSEVFSKENDVNNYLKLITALGNLSIGDEDAKTLIDSMGIRLNLGSLEVKPDEEKFMTRIKEIAKELNIPF